MFDVLLYSVTLSSLQKQLMKSYNIFSSVCNICKNLHVYTYKVITIGGRVSVCVIGHLFGSCVRQVVPNRYALATLVPAAFDLVRRTADAKNEIFGKLAMRTSRPMGWAKKIGTILLTWTQYNWSIYYIFIYIPRYMYLKYEELTH